MTDRDTENLLRRTITEATEMQDMLNTDIAHLTEENAELVLRLSSTEALYVGAKERIAELEIQLDRQLGAMRQMIYAIFGRDLESDEGTEVTKMVDWIHGLRAENTKLIGAEQDRNAYKEQAISLYGALWVLHNWLEDAPSILERFDILKRDVEFAQVKLNEAKPYGIDQEWRKQYMENQT